MGQMSKKLFSLGLGGLIAFSMVGCTGSDNSKAINDSGKTDNTEVSTTPVSSDSGEEIVKPETITMMVNGNFLDEASGQKEVV